MKVRVIRFSHPVRSGPEVGHLQPYLNVLDAHFCAGNRSEAHSIGTIDVYYGEGPAHGLPSGETGARYAIIRSPHVDRQTGEPLVTIVGLEHVVDVEPLTPAFCAKVYGSSGEFMYQSPTPPEPKRDGGKAMSARLA